MSNDSSVLKRFSRGAQHYAQQAIVQRAIAEELIAYIDHSGEIQSVLELGCGTGFLTAHLLEHLPAAQIDALDISEAMLDQAKRNVSGKITWICADARSYETERRYDLIISSSTVHWLLPLESAMKHLASLLSENGSFVFSVMLEGTLGELHAIRREIAPGKLPKAQLPSLETISRALAAAELQVTRVDNRSIPIEYASTRELLRSLHQIGVTASPYSHGTAALNRSELQEIERCYEERHSTAGGCVSASYHLGYFHCRC